MTFGVITTIQRLSIHDGSGIRSTLFFKGCNMRCAWCHNPETWSRNLQLQQFRTKCIGCNSCLDTCEDHALAITAEGIQVNREICTTCGACAKVCPSGALSLVGERISVDEAFRRIQKDTPFFAQTGGGVTASGGEPLLQHAFLLELFKRCREAGINTAIETNLSAEWEIVEQLLPYVDAWMCDLKTVDYALHKKMTGLGNRRTTANLKALIRSKATVIVRTPVIPGVNDNLDEIEAICRLLKPFEEQIQAYELLPFHTLGFDKFTSCGMENPLVDTEDLQRERFQALKLYAKSMLKITK